MVYSTASGQTHKLDALTAAVLLCVGDGVADVSAVQAEVLRELGLESGQILTDRIGAIMEQCKTLGLIDSVP
ncbi:MAG: HPr-rel-A system PqqD family peptide chaperone [Burkholderiales bacterium]|nr:HPr-rel-A system PqqD family peptide chaperone [Burkholderiales bacterium]